jgi:uncharacterized membrane protein
MKRLFWGGAAILAAALLASLIYLPRLPERVPQHWNAAGEIDRWGRPEEAAWTMPIILALMWALFLALPKLSPKPAPMDSFFGAYETMTLAVLSFMALLHWSILQASIAPLDVPRVMAAGMCGMGVVMGNVIGRLRRNHFAGIRTPWTMESDEVWHRTHMHAGRIVFFSSLVGLILALLGFPPLACIIFFAGPLLYSIPMSWWISRQVMKRADS